MPERWRSLALAAAGLLLASVPLILAGAVPWRDVPAVLDGQDPLVQTAILQQTLRVFPWTLERWNAPFAWPGAYSLAYMDPLAAQAILVGWMPGVRAFPALAYNLAMVLTLWLAAGWTYALVRALGGGRLAAASAAVAYVLSPYAVGHLHHLNQLPTPWLPLALWGLVKLAEGRRRGAVALAVALVAQVLSGVYYTVAVAMVVGCVTLFLARRLPRVGWLGLAGVLTVFGIVLWLWSLPYRAAAADVEGFTRTAADGGPFAARVFDFWHASTVRWVPWPPAAVGRPVLYPSLVWVLLAALGLARWMPATLGAARSRRAVVWGLVASAAVATVLCFGRTMPVPGLERELPMPWAWLQDHLWPLRAIRAPARLFLPATLAIAVLGAFPLAHLVRRHRGLGIALLVLAGLDLAPGRLERVRVHPTADERALVDDLRAQPQPTPWAMLPMPSIETEESPADARAMLWAVLAQQPLAGGSTGFVPVPLRALRRACAEGDGAAALRATGVGRLVVDTSRASWPGRPQRQAGTWWVYALKPDPPEN